MYQYQVNHRFSIYLRTITLLCMTSPGTSYNQLAALAGNKNENLDAVYYYQRRYASPTVRPEGLLSFER